MLIAKAENKKRAVRVEENRIPGLPLLASPWSEEETGGNRVRRRDRGQQGGILNAKQAIMRIQGTNWKRTTMYMS